MEQMEQYEKKVGEILPGQRWCELHGCFTIPELKDLIEKIQGAYSEANGDNS